MTMSYDPENRDVIFHGDFPTLEDKIHAINRFSFLSTQVEVGRVDPQRGEDVVIKAAGDVAVFEVLAAAQDIGTALQLVHSRG